MQKINPKKKIYFCLPTHNEEKGLESCVSSINNAMKSVPNCSAKTFVCLNDCNDASKEVATLCKQKYPNLNIKILKSKKGKLNAQERILSRIPFGRTVFFIDSDTEIDKKSVQVILKEFDKHHELLAVGAFPIAKKYKGFNPYKKILSNILNIRSRHPMSEISRLDVRDHHRLAETDPQNKNTSKEHELKSKIFFHGRMFALRSKKYWNKPSENNKVVGDDSYLPDHIIYHYGKNRIRIRYDAVVYFNPFVSIKKHYKTYKRIYFDLKNLKDNFPLFKEIRNHSELILDRDYIKKQNFSTRFYFSCFSLVKKLEKLFFRISLEKDPQKIWKKT